MAHRIGDRIKEGTSSAGTGAFALAGAEPGFVSFASSLTANGDTTWYCATSGTDWEVGLGTRSSAAVLARTSVLASSNAGALVNFSLPPAVFSTIPAARFVGPCFSVYQSVGQAIPSVTVTKLQFPNKDFDTSNAFSTTNHRFQPLVPGFYRLSGSAGFPEPGVSANFSLGIFKNGTEVRRGIQGTAKTYTFSADALVYLNGSTDYVELHVYSSSAVTTDGKAYNCIFQGEYVRPPA